jgi:competence protein ComGC
VERASSGTVADWSIQHLSAPGSGDSQGVAQCIMKWSRNLALKAFKKVELIVVLGVIVLLAALLVIPAMQRAKHKAWRIQCTENLKQFGLAFRTFEIDGGPESSVAGATNREAAFGLIASGGALSHFQVMSNQIGDPKFLVCPADTRIPAKGFGPAFSNTNLSYFINLDATEVRPQMLLCGDRNLTNGLPVQDGVLLLVPDRPAGWTSELHDRQGNVGLADGSAQGLSDSGLRTYVAGSTNRLAMP